MLKRRRVKKKVQNSGLHWVLQPEKSIYLVPEYHVHPGCSAHISTVFFPGSRGKAWIKLMQGHVLAAYYLLQF